MNLRRSGITLAWLLVAAILCAACSSTTTIRGTSPIHTVSLPQGWKTYTYGKAAISVPSTWAVKHATNCPNAAAPGTLLLGLPAVTTYCPAFQYPTSVVTVSQLSPDSGTSSGIPAGQKPVTVNGIPVYLGFGSVTLVQWTVPSLGVKVSGTGPDSSRVMQTLHKA